MATLTGLLFLCAATWSQASPAPSVDDVIKQLRARDQALKSYTLLAKYQIRRRSDFTGQYQSYAVASQIQADRGTGRFSVHTYGQAPAPPAPQKNNEEYLLTTDEYVSFDGEKTTRYTKVPGLDPHGNESEHFLENATVASGRRPSWIVEPEDIVGAHGTLSLDKFLSEGAWKFLEPTGDVVGLELIGPTDLRNPALGEHRYRFWFDTSKGMAPVRKEGCMKRAGDTDWKPYLVVEAGSWWKAVEGVWLPQAYREEHNGATQDGQSHLVQSTVASITYSGINEDYPGSVFRLKIPGGVWVNDVARGTNYKTGMVNDRTIERDVRKAEELRAAYEAARSAPPIPEKPETGWSRIIVAVLGGLLVATVAIGYLAWRWRRKPQLAAGGSIS